MDLMLDRVANSLPGLWQQGTVLAAVLVIIEALANMKSTQAWIMRGAAALALVPAMMATNQRQLVFSWFMYASAAIGALFARALLKGRDTSARERAPAAAVVLAALFVAWASAAQCGCARR